jgi:hypothetical protein
MTRRTTGAGLLALGLLFLAVPPAFTADVYDRYTSPILAKVVNEGAGQPIPKLTPALVAAHSNTVGVPSAALLVIKTNGGHLTKALVQFARQRTSTGAVPVALLERVVTYKPGPPLGVQAQAAMVQLYQDFLFNADLAQVVPTAVGGDVRFVADGGEGYLEAVGNAMLFLVTKPVPGTEVKKSARPVLGEEFDPVALTGSYRLHDDGRRVAKLTLKVEAEGQVSGEYVSDQSGRKYELVGKVLAAKHQFQFTVKFPQSEQVFTAWAFTRDAGALCGFSKMQEREFGFYATRLDEE